MNKVQVEIPNLLGLTKEESAWFSIYFTNKQMKNLMWLLRIYYKNHYPSIFAWAHKKFIHNMTPVEYLKYAEREAPQVFIKELINKLN